MARERSTSRMRRRRSRFERANEWKARGAAARFARGTPPERSSSTKSKRKTAAASWRTRASSGASEAAPSGRGRKGGNVASLAEPEGKEPGARDFLRESVFEIGDRL